MKFDTNIPIYIQIINEIKKDIVLGKISTGDKLPSTRDLAMMYGVNPNTVQRVYKEMELEGLSYTKRGKGTYINESKEMVQMIKTQMAENVINKFIIGMKELGFSYDEMIKVINNKKIKEGETNANTKN
ncbi:GntR family transcriptional regulator [Abyssisolibacter fermentans]|uniref:GntR family transcriptional regulator n=1 Tax=Abyssisolibacter fermentans TaxID=1766203 RepID=UPI0008321D35|nr:GntR family transcriptional regulator [Abyssisolibacter fermentans]